MRARGCGGSGDGNGNGSSLEGKCPGESTEAEDCKISECPGDNPHFKASEILIFF